MSILMRIKQLERDVEELKKRKGRPDGRLSEMAHWIRKQFAEEDEIEVSMIKARAKVKGYSSQMISIARREMLDDEIGVSHSKGNGWMWIKLNKDQRKKLK